MKRALTLACSLAFATLLACANGQIAGADAPTGLDASAPTVDVGIGDAGPVDAAEDVPPVLDAGVDARDAESPPDADAAPAPDAVEDVVDADADAADAPPFPTVIAAVETRLSTDAVRAGDSVFVSCDALNTEGELVLMPSGVSLSYAYAPDASLVRGEGEGEFVGRRVGDATIACRVPSLGLVDDTPADLRIVPGLPYTIVTELDAPIVTAGEPVEAACTAYDVFGNLVPDAPLELLAAPFGEAVNLFGLRAVIERAGQYTMTCSIEGATEFVSALLEVRPALPATLAMQLFPDRALFGVGEVVSLEWTALDRFGNRIQNPPIEFSAVPAVPTFGQGRFRFDAEGVFRLCAAVGLPTESGEPLVRCVDVAVNSTGPSIVCDAPFDGEMVETPIGEPLLFAGRVTDASGVREVRVNGEEALLFPGGTFQADVTPRFGVNFVEIEAFDDFGAGNARVCAFLASDTYLTPDAFLDDDISLALGASAFDDGDRGDGLDSLSDILFAIVNSRGLVDQLDAALRAADPLYPQRCVVDAWLFCAVSFGLNYRSLSIGGPQDVSLSLLDGGLRADATIRGLDLGLRIRGTFSTSGELRLSRLGLGVSFGIGLAGGRPRVTLRSVDRVDVGGIDSDFSGITGFILDLLVDIFEGTIRDLVRDEVSDFVSETFTEVLDDLVSDLGIEALDANFDVPRLDGLGSTNLGFGARFTSLDATSARALFGLGSRFTGPVLRSDSLGVALADEAALDGRPLVRAVRASVALGLLNQVLHTLWQARFFDATLGDALLGDEALSGVSVELRAGLPPLVVGREGGAVDVHIGAWEVAISYPELLAEPLTVRIGAVARAQVRLVGDEEIDFEGLVLEEFYFDAVGTSLEPETRDVLDGFFRRVVQRVIDTALEGALPALPIPAFELPASVAAFGLPAGAYLGLVDALLELNASHFVLLGNFGTR